MTFKNIHLQEIEKKLRQNANPKGASVAIESGLGEVSDSEINQKNGKAQTMLDVLLANRNIEERVIQYLIKRGGRSGKNNLAHILAVQNQNPEIIENKADLNCPDKNLFSKKKKIFFFLFLV